MLNETRNALSRQLLAFTFSGLALGSMEGCVTVAQLDNRTCTETTQTQTLPILQYFGIHGHLPAKAEISTSCVSTQMRTLAVQIGRQPDGTLHPYMAATGLGIYKILQEKIQNGENVEYNTRMLNDFEKNLEDRGITLDDLRKTVLAHFPVKTQKPNDLPPGCTKMPHGFDCNRSAGPL